MDSPLIAAKVFGFSGLVIGFCLWQLWSLKRLEKERERRAPESEDGKQV